MKLIDLSFPIQPHWRWGYSQTLKYSLEQGDDFRASVLTLPAHCYTHVDTLLHCNPGGAPDLAELPVDTYCGEAAVVDLTHLDAGQTVSVEDIKRGQPEIKPNDIILLKTGWDLKRDISSKEYWTDAPCVGEAAADYLYSLSPFSVGFDFPQDEILRQATTYKGCLPMKQSTTHSALLLKGVFLIEYLCNLTALTGPRTFFMALPLKLVGGEGCPVRAVAVQW